jgi:DNA-binding transcriptional regulator YdaS (Cro superfamily)
MIKYQNVDYKGGVMVKTGLDKAVALAGSQAKLAMRLEVSQQAISEWVARGFLPVGRIDDVLNAVDPSCKSIKPRDLIDPELVALMDKQFAREESL